MLKNTGSDIFDEAYFVIKESAATSNAVISENDMIAEANKILNENRLSEYCMNGVRKNRVLKKIVVPLCILASLCVVASVIILIAVIV